MRYVSYPDFNHTHHISTFFVFVIFKSSSIHIIWIIFVELWIKTSSHNLFPFNGKITLIWLFHLLYWTKTIIYQSCWRQFYLQIHVFILQNNFTRKRHFSSLIEIYNTIDFENKTKQISIIIAITIFDHFDDTVTVRSTPRKRITYSKVPKNEQ